LEKSGEDSAEDSNHDLHAWAEVYIPGGGWRGFDPTLGLAVGDRHIAIATNQTQCISAQGYCIDLAPYAIGTRIFWGMVIPSAIFVVLVFGHEFWRRICPLYFFSQLPRALGIGPISSIEKNPWLEQNHFYVQFVLFYLGITARILLVNSVRPALGIFFILTLLSAAAVVTLYGGRSWCHYVCPFGMVQTVFTGPRGLLASRAHQAKPHSITQSMCRTVEASGVEASDCISCKSSCMDIDAEASYWAQMYKPGRKLVQYGYLGLVVGYFSYYWLYAGNFGYYFSGVWSHESRTLEALRDPGFYILGHAIAIPKLIAAPLTLGLFAAISCGLCSQIERYYRGYLKQKHQPVVAIDTAEKSLHRMFSVCTFLAFNIFFIYGGRPEINNLPIAMQFGFQTVIVTVSSLWFYRTWGRSSQRYEQEKNADKRRRQLKKLPIQLPELLDGRPVEQLDEREVAVLAKTLPQLAGSHTSSQGKQNQNASPVDKAPPNNNVIPLPKTIIRKRTAAPKPSEQNQPVDLPKTSLRIDQKNR
ncbi:MAG: 4Fe-4S binding protein, partial [Cyanobacteria bacterium J06649_4]